MGLLVDETAIMNPSEILAMQRRTFLQTSGAAVAALLARPVAALPQARRYVKTIGLQLYTLRNQLEVDVPGTIGAVRDAGYHQVELMRVVGGEPVYQAAIDAGLRVTSAMIDWQTLVHPEREGVPSLDQTLEVAARQKLQYLVIPYVARGSRETVAQWSSLARRANRAGAACRQANVQLCYHHHSFEFEKLDGERSGWDVLVRELDPELVRFEIDTFWAAIGGVDPVKLIQELGTRVAQLHLKDLPSGTPVIYDEGQVPREAFQAVGAGSLDWPAILQAAEAAGVAQCHVEQDHAEDPLASIRQSIRYLQSLA